MKDEGTGRVQWRHRGLLIFAAFLIMAVSYGCPWELVSNDLLLRNESDRGIVALLNLQYPDSSLKLAMPDHSVDPHHELYVGNCCDLKRSPGLTLFIFDDAYFTSRWHEGVGRPDTYLEENKILRRYHLSHHELDSLGWSLVYP